MYFTTSTLLALLSATVAVAAPAAHPEPVPGKDWGVNKYEKECKEDWEDKWKTDAWKKSEKLFYFDAEYVVLATPDQVINTTQFPVPGQPGARGIFKYGINVAENTICYNITLSGVTGAYRSAAITATHIHEAVKGRSGPPRLAFPNPTGPDSRRTSYGCLKGPFFVGTNNTAVPPQDNAAGFHVRQIVANPSGFFTDTHTSQYVQGAVRGQLA